MKAKPSTTASYGRNEQGRFTEGNKCARGNPFARQVARLRSALLSAVTPADVRAIAKGLVVRAKEGDIVAVKELLDRLLGKPLEADVLDKIEQLERILNELTRQAKSN